METVPPALEAAAQDEDDGTQYLNLSERAGGDDDPFDEDEQNDAPEVWL
ncbi:hypothetical protein ACP4OV_031575 [Aristida adscensionis]